MDPLPKERRIGILSVIAALVVVCGFWGLLIPHTQQYKSYRREAKVKEILQAIKPPPGAKVVSITTTHTGAFVLGTGVYLDNTDFDTMKAHYHKEFARHGFVLKEERSQGSQRFLHFCAPNLDATLGTAEPQAHPFEYAIFINWTDAAC